jgi:hypothetical protein
MLSKMASSSFKPNQSTVILPGSYFFPWFHQFKFGDVPGIGPKTVQSLDQTGLVYIKDIISNANANQINITSLLQLQSQTHFKLMSIDQKQPPKQQPKQHHIQSVKNGSIYPTASYLQISEQHCRYQFPTISHELMTKLYEIHHGVDSTAAVEQSGPPKVYGQSKNRRFATKDQGRQLLLWLIEYFHARFEEDFETFHRLPNKLVLSAVFVRPVATTPTSTRRHQHISISKRAPITLKWIKSNDTNHTPPEVLQQLRHNNITLINKIIWPILQSMMTDHPYPARNLALTAVSFLETGSGHPTANILEQFQNSNANNNNNTNNNKSSDSMIDHDHDDIVIDIDHESATNRHPNSSPTKTKKSTSAPTSSISIPVQFTNPFDEFDDEDNKSTNNFKKRSIVKGKQTSLKSFLTPLTTTTPSPKPKPGTKVSSSTTTSTTIKRSKINSTAQQKGIFLL